VFDAIAVVAGLDDRAVVRVRWADGGDAGGERSSPNDLEQLRFAVPNVE